MFFILDYLFITKKSKIDLKAKLIRSIKQEIKKVNIILKSALFNSRENFLKFFFFQSKTSCFNLEEKFVFKKFLIFKNFY